MTAAEDVLKFWRMLVTSLAREGSAWACREKDPGAERRDGVAWFRNHVVFLEDVCLELQFVAVSGGHRLLRLGLQGVRLRGGPNEGVKGRVLFWQAEWSDFGFGDRFLLYSLSASHL